VKTFNFSSLTDFILLIVGGMKGEGDWGRPAERLLKNTNKDQICFRGASTRID